VTPVISLAGVSRRYGRHDALADVTADIGTPSITGLLGRNGAGKSTLLRILAGRSSPPRAGSACSGPVPRRTMPCCAA